MINEGSNIDYMSKEEILAYQNEKLVKVLPYIASIPFYKKKLSREGIDAKGVKEILDLQKIPFTTKEELRLSMPMERTSLKCDGIVFFLFKLRDYW